MLIASTMSTARRWFSRRSRARLVTLRGETMGTTWSVKIATRDTDETAPRAAIDAVLDDVIGQMSTWRDDSDLARWNRAPAGSRHVVPPGFAAVLACALDVARDSGGAYDPTVGPLVNLWGFGPDGERREPPGADALAQARARSGWQRIVFDRATGSLEQPGALSLDFSAIAKGYAVDAVSLALVRLGMADHLVEIGGELRAQGSRPDGQPWRIALEAPDGSASNAVIVLSGRAVATSGDYWRYYEHDSRRYSHTIDPRTGEPVTHGVASVSVVHRDAMHADAYATALTVLGADAGLAFASEHRLAARIVTRTPHGCACADSPAFTKILQE
jgi:thiamine biosynthesis lipoprotein